MVYRRYQCLTICDTLRVRPQLSNGAFLRINPLMQLAILSQTLCNPIVAICKAQCLATCETLISCKQNPTVHKYTSMKNLEQEDDFRFQNQLIVMVFSNYAKVTGCFQHTTKYWEMHLNQGDARLSERGVIG
jgi:hypothetical protein